MNCPHQNKLRADLPPLTKRIAKLPIDERGYPVPWFVQWIDGKPDFRIANTDNLIAAVQRKLCCVCGEPLGVHKAFVIGPMCVVNRTTSEPPSHCECAEWSLKGCPFLTKPKMVRRGIEDAVIQEGKSNVAGFFIERNPGVMALWVTRKYYVTPAPQMKILFDVGEPERVTWWREGRTATHAEVVDSIESGLPFLREACDHEPNEIARQEALEELAEQVKRAASLLPANV